MKWDLASAKEFLGVTGTADDSKIQAVMSMALLMAENYCRRKFTYAREQAKFYDVHYETLSLHRYPVAMVHQVTTAEDCRVHAAAGLLKFTRPVVAEVIGVDYEGGFKEFPADLVMALMQIVQSQYATVSGGAAAVVGGTIKSISSNGSRVEYDTSGGAVSAGVDRDTGLPSMAISILDSYRRELC